MLYAIQMGYLDASKHFQIPAMNAREAYGIAKQYEPQLEVIQIFNKVYNHYSYDIFKGFYHEI